MRIIIPDVPPSVNHYFCRARSGRLYISREGKGFMALARAIAFQEARKTGWRVIAAGRFIYVAIAFEFANRRFSDPNNLLKLLLDSLQGIVFENDKWVLPLVWNARIAGVRRTIIDINEDGGYIDVSSNLV